MFRVILSRYMDEFLVWFEYGNEPSGLRWLCLQYHDNNVIMFCLNTTLFLNSYMFRLAKIRLHIKKLKKEDIRTAAVVGFISQTHKYDIMYNLIYINI